jgi:hypothetical protein
MADKKGACGVVDLLGFGFGFGRGLGWLGHAPTRAHPPVVIVKFRKSASAEDKARLLDELKGKGESESESESESDGFGTTNDRSSRGR